MTRRLLALRLRTLYVAFAVLAVAALAYGAYRLATVDDRDRAAFTASQQDLLAFPALAAAEAQERFYGSSGELAADWKALSDAYPELLGYAAGAKMTVTASPLGYSVRAAGPTGVYAVNGPASGARHFTCRVADRRDELCERFDPCRVKSCTDGTWRPSAVLRDRVQAALVPR